MSTIGGVFASIPVFNMLVPDEGPRAITITANFLNVDEFDVSLLQQIESGRIRAIQSFYYDNAEQAEDVIFTAGTTGQRMVLPGNTQGYRNALVDDQGAFTLASTGSGKFQIILMNVPFFPAQWAATI